MSRQLKGFLKNRRKKMFGTALVHEHEIAKNIDFQFAFDSIIRNTAMLDKLLVSANRNYVIGGEVIAESTGSMNVYVRPIWANGRSIELPVYSESASGLIFIQPPVSEDRIDILEARGILKEYDAQRRAFFDPELLNGRYYTVPTKVELIVDYKIVSGEEGSAAAPPVDDGYVKLAEILLPYGENVILNSRIRNITALVNGEENAAWTADKRTSFYLGSLSDIKTMFGLEHNKDGTHRAGIIKLPYLKIGTAEDALRGSVLPLGRGYVVEQDEWLPRENMADSLEDESIIRARDDAVEKAARIAKDLELEGRINAIELQVLENTGKIALLWDAVFADMTTNPFMFAFADLNGIILIRGNWDHVHQLLDCSYIERSFNVTFENLDTIALVHGVWNKPLRRLEC
jgi:hypothetical protein